MAKILKGYLRNVLDMESVDACTEEDQQVSVLSTEELATISAGEHVTKEALATTSDGDYAVTPKIRQRSRSRLARSRSNKHDSESL